MSIIKDLSTVLGLDLDPSAFINPGTTVSEIRRVTEEKKEEEEVGRRLPAIVAADRKVVETAAQLALSHSIAAEGRVAYRGPSDSNALAEAVRTANALAQGLPESGMKRRAEAAEQMASEYAAKADQEARTAQSRPNDKKAAISAQMSAVRAQIAKTLSLQIASGAAVAVDALPTMKLSSPGGSLPVAASAGDGLEAIRASRAAIAEAKQKMRQYKIDSAAAKRDKYKSAKETLKSDKDKQAAAHREELLKEHKEIDRKNMHWYDWALAILTAGASSPWSSVANIDKGISRGDKSIVAGDEDFEPDSLSTNYVEEAFEEGSDDPFANEDPFGSAFGEIVDEEEPFYDPGVSDWDWGEGSSGSEDFGEAEGVETSPSPTQTTTPGSTPAPTPEQKAKQLADTTGASRFKRDGDTNSTVAIDTRAQRQDKTPSVEITPVVMKKSVVAPEMKAKASTTPAQKPVSRRAKFSAGTPANKSSGASYLKNRGSNVMGAAFPAKRSLMQMIAAMVSQPKSTTSMRQRPRANFDIFRSPSKVVVSPKLASAVFTDVATVHVWGGRRWHPAWNTSDTMYDAPSRVDVYLKDGTKKTFAGDIQSTSIFGGNRTLVEGDSASLPYDLLGADFTPERLGAVEAAMQDADGNDLIEVDVPDVTYGHLVATQDGIESPERVMHNAKVSYHMNSRWQR